VKLTYAIFFTFLITSFYIEALDLFWQGMHTPNMFLHRYAWIFSTLLIYISAIINKDKRIANRFTEINFLMTARSKRA